MPPNIQNVSFSNPAYMVAPDLVVQQQQVARQQALADELRRQSLEDIQVAPGSRVSWTQGAAKLADALISRSQYKKADQQNSGMAQQYAQALKGMFGGQQAAPAQPPQAPQQSAPQAPPPDPYARGSYGSGGIDDPGNLTPPNQPPPTPVAGTPSAPAPSPGGDAGGASSRGPWSLSGNPGQDMASYMLNPEEYGKQVIASHAPVDMAKMVQQAQDAAQRGDYAGAAALYANIQKQNYIAPVSVRQGGVALDPVTHQPVFQAAQAPEGSNVNYGPDGKAQSITPIQGGAAAIQNAAAAKATGTAAGDLVQIYDRTTHQMVNVPKSAVLSAGSGGGNPMAAAPPLGAEKAFETTGENSAHAFQDISNGAADVPNRVYALNQMLSIASDPNSKFGAGSNGLNHFNSLLGTISQSTGIAFDPKAATNANEFQKWATQYSARSGQELGLSGSDARTQLAVHATPNGEMTRQALQSVIPQMVGIENAKQGYAAAANTWQQQHGPQDVQNFRTAWNQVYNPAIYTHMAQGPQVFAGWVKSLSPQQAAQVRQQYVKLKQLGALPQ